MSALYRFDRADVVVSLDADFLGFGPAAVRYTKDFSSRRRMGTPSDQLNRLYAVEPVPTVTGANADHRLALKARDILPFASSLAAALGVAGATAGTLPNDVASRWIPAIAKDLGAHRGTSVVVAGDHQPAAVHALARGMNQALGNVGATVTYDAPVAVIAGRRRRVDCRSRHRHGGRTRPGAVRPRDRTRSSRRRQTSISARRSRRCRSACTSGSITTKRPSSVTGTRQKRTTSSRGATCARSTARCR